MARQIARKVLVGSTACCLALCLNGCLINRVAVVKEQFCDFDSNFSLMFAGSADFSFHSPVLLDKDVRWIAGTSPTRMNKTGAEMSMVFILEKAGPDPRPEDEITLELKLHRIGDDYKLKKVRFDPKLNAMINADFLDEATLDSAARNLCESGWSLASRSMDIDISDRDLDELPHRTEILGWLGSPFEKDENENSLTYEYRLKNNDPDPKRVRFTIWFDSAGEKPLRMESQYSRYRSSADFVDKKMSMRVNI